MSTKSQLLKSLGVSLLAMAVIVLIVLYPRQLQVTVDRYEIKATAAFSYEDYARQIGAFWKNTWVNGSLGVTRYGHSVEQEVAKAMGRSLAVIAGAFAISSILGIGKGILDHRWSRGRRNPFGSAASIILQSMPDFLVILLVEWFIINYVPQIRFFGHKGLSGYLIPVLLVSFFPALYIARITHAALDANVGKMYIQVARAKGLSERKVFVKYILRNSLTAILIQLSPLFVYLLSNLLLVEYLMNYPGAALRLYQAIDYNRSFGTGANYEPGVIIETAFCFMVLLLVIQWVSLAARHRLDPRPEGGEGE